MFSVGIPQFGWFITLKASKRNLPPAIGTDGPVGSFHPLLTESAYKADFFLNTGIMLARKFRRTVGSVLCLPVNASGILLLDSLRKRCC